MELAHYSEAPDVIVCPCLFAPLGRYSGRLHEWLWTQPTLEDASVVFVGSFGSGCRP